MQLSKLHQHICVASYTTLASGGARPEEWCVSKVPCRGHNASGGRIVRLPGAYWVCCASRMANVGASLPLHILKCCRCQEDILLIGAWHTTVLPSGDTDDFESANPEAQKRLGPW